MNSNATIPDLKGIERMSREYCHFCNTEFISGRACRTEVELHRCGEWEILQAAEKTNREIREAFEQKPHEQRDTND